MDRRGFFKLLGGAAIAYALPKPAVRKPPMYLLYIEQKISDADIRRIREEFYNAVNSSNTQRMMGALQVEDLSPVMLNVTFNVEHIKLQKALRSH